MKRVVLAATACAIGLSMITAGAAGAAPRFEMATIVGTPVNNAGFFRVNVATGQVWQQWGGTTQFSPVVDNTPVPGGEYHITTLYWTDPSGKVSWNLYRFDAASGRAWMALGGGGAPLVWNELAPPK
ncbi:MAG: hypothetical protein P4L73_17520 [Caulobacteraceae bacterium]|nr:hypothetical protein [Caulobacteraceae bacterium]